MSLSIIEKATRARPASNGVITDPLEGMTSTRLEAIEKSSGEPVFTTPRALRSGDLEFTFEEAMQRLRDAQAGHSMWKNPLFEACNAGQLTREDFQFIFGQYYLYSRNFTRYLAALMANSDDDFHRAQLAENLWEEGGMKSPEDRHAEIFRRFLRDGLAIDIGNIDYIDATRYFVREYLDFCLRANGAAGSAFLSLGTEGIVARMYEILVAGLEKAGIPKEHLTFFYLHMECDDEHAETLENMMVSYLSVPGWFETCMRSMTYALDLRERFFCMLYEHLQLRRMASVIAPIEARRSLVPGEPDMEELRCRPSNGGTVALYDNTNDKLNIEFTVERVPFATEALDSRILRIPPGKNNERHKHPHESVFYVIQGKAQIQVNECTTEVEAGEMAFVPRWAIHQSVNIGEGDLVMLAITDYALTRRVFLGDHIGSTRMKRAQAPLPGEKQEAPKEPSTSDGAA